VWAFGYMVKHTTKTVHIDEGIFLKYRKIALDETEKTKKHVTIRTVVERKLNE